MVADSAQRLRALDPQQSFCVTAPAGSGKTELLVQRLLALLARVEQPEAVLAITFTRKAAAEMRERVLQALLEADGGQPCIDEHKQRTRTLAEAALAASAQRDWSLLDNPARLNIKTIDSFCATLTRQMPLLSHFGGPLNITDDAVPLYEQAVTELFGQLHGEHEVSTDLRLLMLHFDNNWTRLQQLLVAMLARRDQWLSYMGVSADPGAAESLVRDTTELLVSERLSLLQKQLAPFAAELCELVDFAAQNLKQDGWSELPGATPADLPRWRQLLAFVLTRTSSWRKTVDKRVGFPVDGKAQKTRMLALLQAMAERDGLLETLGWVRYLPQSQGQSWQLVLSLSRLLPVLAAHLLLVFKQHGSADHSQVSIAALQALGTDDQPTDLALKLDYAIHHLLIDEFQDTAVNQYNLVKRLTRGWGEYNHDNPQNPHTLLIVGDAMQSIYGFRDANVGLFLQARDRGFNGVALQPLDLVTNFRSDERLVDWVNSTFEQAFPQREDIAQGAIPFAESTPHRARLSAHSAVELHGFSGDQPLLAEAQFVADTCAAAIADDSCESLALLARNRNHLRDILALLKERKIPWQAEAIDNLADSGVIHDLMTLCRLWLNRADRVAWLAFLRAPWCGLTLADLLLLTQKEADESASLALRIPQLLARDSLSEDARARLHHAWSCLDQAFAQRERLGLHDWLEQLWLDLRGPALVYEPQHLQDAQRFFELLEELDQSPQGLTLELLQRRVDKLFAENINPQAKVQVMTLHKAKGLEFDWVLIPGLSRVPRSDSRELLYWDNYEGEAGQLGFMLAADDHAAADEPTLYNYLQEQRKRKRHLEATRLFYVGGTRAVKRLFLTASVNFDDHKEAWKTPGKTSLLHCIWPLFQSAMEVHDDLVAAAAPAAAAAPRQLRRIALAALPAPGPPPSDATTVELENNPGFSSNAAQRHAGTVIHEILQRVAQGQVSLEQVADAPWWRLRLRQLGLSEVEDEQARLRVQQSLEALRRDPQAPWMLNPQHRESRCEHRVSALQEDGSFRESVVDRSFIDEGVRWVIDYKSASPEPQQPLEEFLTQQAKRYSAQLLRYASVYEGLPVRMALYFTALGKLLVYPDTVV